MKRKKPVRAPDHRACTGSFPFNHLSLKQIQEFERLDRLLLDCKHTPREAVRYAVLFAMRYFPPCDLERMGAA